MRHGLFSLLWIFFLYKNRVLLKSSQLYRLDLCSSHSRRHLTKNKTCLRFDQLWFRPQGLLIISRISFRASMNFPKASRPFLIAVAIRSVPRFFDDHLAAKRNDQLVLSTPLSGLGVGAMWRIALTPPADGAVDWRLHDAVAAAAAGHSRGEVRSLMEASVRHFLIQRLASGDGPHFHQSIWSSTLPTAPRTRSPRSIRSARLERYDGGLVQWCRENAEY